MNRRQKVVLWVGAVLACAAILFPVVPDSYDYYNIGPLHNVAIPRVAFVFDPALKGRFPLPSVLPVLLVLGLLTATAFATAKERS